MTGLEMEDRLGKIKFYFNLGLRYNEIVFVLQFIHGYSLSKRHLIRILHKEGLYRHKNPTDIMDVLEFIMEEQRKSGVLHGYRWMYQKCKEKGINALKEEVRLLMRVLDPESVELRKAHRLRRRKYMSKGPNYIWHLDSYDKLRPFGICINGCVDGFSRKIMWLNAYYTNSDPKVIGGYFLETIQSLGGCPIIVRGDKGTENSRVCTFQRFFRRNGDDNFFGDKSFMYGCSTSNQRIEYWWGFFRKECIEFWLALFDQLKAAGHFDSGFLDKNFVLFSFLSLIQTDLDETAKVWDSHLIRRSRTTNVPTGRPNIMYSIPELYSTDNYLCEIDDEEIEICKEHATFRSGIHCDEDIYNMCIQIIAENSLLIPKDPYQALDLYLELRQKIISLLP